MTNQKLSKFQPKTEKVIIRKKAAKPMTPDELAERATANKPKSKHFDLSVLRSATGSTEPIHLFRAIRALGPKHIPAIIHLLQGAANIKQHSAFSLMQPVYVIIDGTGAYINDYCLSYVIDADANYLRCLNAEGTMVASFPADSTSILTTTEFFKIEKELKPASEKPIRTKSPLVGASDFEPPTINDAIIATRIPKKRLAHSDLYTLFTSFSGETKLTLGTVHEGEKILKKKNRVKDVVEDAIEVKSKKPKSKKLKSTKVKNILKGLDLSGYDADPEKEEPKEVLRQKARIELNAKLAENENRKVFMPLLPNAKSAVAIATNKFKNKIELDDGDDCADEIKQKKPKKLKKSDSATSKTLSTKTPKKSDSGTKQKPTKPPKPTKTASKEKDTISTKESLRAIRMFL